MYKFNSSEVLNYLAKKHPEIKGNFHEFNLYILYDSINDTIFAVSNQLWCRDITDPEKLKTKEGVYYLNSGLQLPLLICKNADEVEIDNLHKHSTPNYLMSNCLSAAKYIIKGKLFDLTVRGVTEDGTPNPVNIYLVNNKTLTLLTHNDDYSKGKFHLLNGISLDWPNTDDDYWKKADILRPNEKTLDQRRSNYVTVIGLDD